MGYLDWDDSTSTTFDNTGKSDDVWSFDVNSVTYNKEIMKADDAGSIKAAIIDTESPEI